jgi:hypothetical protein
MRYSPSMTSTELITTEPTRSGGPCRKERLGAVLILCDDATLPDEARKTHMDGPTSRSKCMIWSRCDNDSHVYWYRVPLN